MPEIIGEIQKVRDRPAIFGAYEADLDVLLGVAASKKRQFHILISEDAQQDRVDRLRRWYFGLVQIVADGLGVLKDDLDAKLRCDVGFVAGYVPGRNGPMGILKSIARGISYTSLREYVTAAEVKLFDRYVPGLSSHERKMLDKRVEERFGVSRPQ